MMRHVRHLCVLVWATWLYPFLHGLLAIALGKTPMSTNWESFDFNLTNDIMGIDVLGESFTIFQPLYYMPYFLISLVAYIAVHLFYKRRIGKIQAAAMVVITAINIGIAFLLMRGAASC